MLDLLSVNGPGQPGRARLPEETLSEMDSEADGEITKEAPTSHGDAQVPCWKVVNHGFIVVSNG